MQNFDELKTRSQVVKDPQQTLANKAGLRSDVRRELLRQPIYSLEHAFQVTEDMLEYLNNPANKRFGASSVETAPKKSGAAKQVRSIS